MKSSGIYKHIHELEEQSIHNFDKKICFGGEYESRNISYISFYYDNEMSKSIESYVNSLGTPIATNLRLKSIKLKTNYSNGGLAVLLFLGNSLIAVSDYVDPFNTGEDGMIEFTFSSTNRTILSKNNIDPYQIIFVNSSGFNGNNGGSYTSISELYEKYIGSTLEKIQNDLVLKTTDIVILPFDNHYDCSSGGVLKASTIDNITSLEMAENAGHLGYNPNVIFNINVETAIRSKKHAVYLTDKEEETLKKLLSAASVAINE